jgi:hypothetical protein
MMKTLGTDALTPGNYIRIKEDTFYGLPLPSAGYRQAPILYFGSSKGATTTAGG